MKIALIVGSTGLIGKQLLQLLLESPRYSRVVAITRKPLDIKHSKLLEVVTDLHHLNEQGDQLRCDDVFCCLGTTMAKAGSKEKFEEADLQYPLAIAKICKKLGAKQYLLVSALGADRNSGIYYNRIKGEVEHQIQEVGYETLHIFQPSLLLGDRKESRPGETAGKIFTTVFGFLIPAKYKAIDSAKIARAMSHYAAQEEKGRFVHVSKDLQKF